MVERLYKAGIVPVVKLEDATSAVPLARAIYAGGIDMIEITFRTAAAAPAIAAIARDCPEMAVGAGTVLTQENLHKAYEAGATYIVAPGLNPAIVTQALALGLFMLPGVATPTEIEQGMALGLSAFKLFPAGIYGGVKAVDALSAPYSMVRFVPTGGVSAKNAEEYFCHKAVLAVGGTWIAPAKLIAEKRFDEITALTREAKALYDAVRKQEG